MRLQQQILQGHQIIIYIILLQIFNMTLNVRLVSGQLTHDTQIFSNMDPYCVIQLGHEKKRSRTKQEAGKKPVWNETFTFYGQDNNLSVTVMDEDVVTDDVVGNGTVTVSKFRGNPVEMQEVVQLYYQGKTAGKILLMISGGSGGGGGYQQPPLNNLNNMNANMFQVYNHTQNQPQQPYNPYQMQQQQWGSHGNIQPQQYQQQQQQWGSNGNIQPQYNQNSYGNQGYVPPINNSPWGDTNQNNGWGNFNPVSTNQNNFHQPPNPNNNVNPLNLLGGVLNNQNQNQPLPPPQMQQNSNPYPYIASIGGMGGLINKNNNQKNPYNPYG